MNDNTPLVFVPNLSHLTPGEAEREVRALLGAAKGYDHVVTVRYFGRELTFTKQDEPVFILSELRWADERDSGFLLAGR